MACHCTATYMLNGHCYCDKHARSIGAWIPVIPGSPCEYAPADRALVVGAAVLAVFALAVLVVLVVVS